MNFGSKTVKEEERNGRRTVFLSFSKEKIPFYQREILKHSNDIFVPMTFLLTEGQYQVYYDISGLTLLTERIKSMEQQRISSPMLFCIRALRRIICQLWHAEDHLLLLSDFELAPDVIFLDERLDSIKIAFVPSEYKGDGGEVSMIRFMGLLEAVVGDDQWSAYSHCLCQELRQRHISFREMDMLLENMERDFVYSA